jgi:hypothetical protein
MAKETADRYPAMDDLRADLERALTDADYIVANPSRDSTTRFDLTKKKLPQEKIETLMDWAPPAGTTGSARRRSRAPLVAGIVVAILLGACAVGAYMGGLFGGAGAPVAGPAVGAGRTIGKTGKAIASGGDEGGSGKGGALGAAGGGLADTAGKEKPPVEPVPEKIEVRVVSEPEGAVVFVEGMGQVCSAAPCTVALAAGAPVRISAKSGDREEATAFTPSAENREIKFDLKPKAGAGGGAKRPKGGTDKNGGSSGGGGAGKDPQQGSGLKIPDLFKNN